MIQSDRTDRTDLKDSTKIAAVLAAAALPDAPLAMPEQRLEPARLFEALRSILSAPRRRAEP